MISKKAWAGVGIAILIAVFVAIAFSVRGPDSRTWKVGVIGPFTGEGATYGQSMRRGYELALPDDGSITLVFEDDKLSAKDGLSAINKLVFADHVQVILGSAASSVTLAIAPVAEDNEVVLFSSISTSDELRTAGEYVFRNVPRNEVQGVTAARFLFSNLGNTTVAILKKNDEYATNLSSSFRAEFERLGGRVLLDDAYQPGTSDFRAVIARLKGIGAEAVYVPGNYEEVARILKQASEVGLNSTFMGGDGSYSPELINIAGSAAEGSYYTVMSVGQTDYYRAFKAAFEREYGREPDVYDAYAYEAASIIYQAIRDAGYDAGAIKDYLLSHTFESLTGPLEFDKDGEVTREYGVFTVLNGEFVEVGSE